MSIHEISIMPNKLAPIFFDELLTYVLNHARRQHVSHAASELCTHLVNSLYN